MAILAAFVMLPAIALLGGGYDLVRATTYSAKLRGALESAVLASASLTNTRSDVSKVVTEYLKVNLADDPVFRDKVLNGGGLTITPSTAINSKTVTITARASIDTFFLHLVGVKQLPISAESIANQSKQDIELALVLDISSSMRGQKIAALETAAASFIDKILSPQNIEHTSMSIIPFGGTVNIGPDLFKDHAVSEGSAIKNPNKSQYSLNKAVPNGAFRFDDGLDCIEYVDGDFDGDLLPNVARPQVPHFWKWWNFHPWCPGPSNAMLLNTNDGDALKSLVESLELSDGTGMDIGMMWGMKALSPAWKGKLGDDSEFNDRPYPYNGPAMKVLVIMTDGEITQQYRPRDVSINNVHGNRDKKNNRTPNVNARSNGGNSKNQQTVVDKGNNNSKTTDRTAVAHFKRLCAEAKHKDVNVVVYTIGFQIKKNNISHQLLGECASDPSKYHFVEELDIQSAFDSIAASVNKLRIIG